MEGKGTVETMPLAKISAASREEKKSDGLSLRLRRKSLDSATTSEPMKVSFDSNYNWFLFF